MAMFLGVALMQSVHRHRGRLGRCSSGLETRTRAVLLAIAGWLALASLAFRALPKSPLLANQK
jgi:hypothetical protein